MEENEGVKYVPLERVRDAVNEFLHLGVVGEILNRFDSHAIVLSESDDVNFQKFLSEFVEEKQTDLREIKHGVYLLIELLESFLNQKGEETLILDAEETKLVNSIASVLEFRSGDHFAESVRLTLEKAKILHLIYEMKEEIGDAGRLISGSLDDLANSLKEDDEEETETEVIDFNKEAGVAAVEATIAALGDAGLLNTPARSLAQLSSPDRFFVESRVNPSWFV